MGAGRDERAFVRAAQRGSASGIEALFRLHWPRAHRAAYLVVHDAAAAEDIAQEAFLAAVRNLDRFDRGRPFGPWLHRIVVNRAIDWARARQLRGEAELVDAVAAPEHAAPLDDSLLAALAALPPDHRAVIVLRHLLEYTPGEIAELLGLPRGTVNSRLRRGLDSLEGDGVKRELERIEIPDEHEARERSWAVVSAAFAEREPQPRRRSWRPVAVVALAVVVVAGLLSPPGRAVLDEIRQVVGVEESAPALFSLPAPGRLLVTADSGVWVVDEDGSKRLLGDYREASWSPFGRFVVAARANELVALTPDGTVRWSLARPDVRLPRWGGTQDRHADRVLLPRATAGRRRRRQGRSPARWQTPRSALPCGCRAAATGSRTRRATAASASSTSTPAPWSTATHRHGCSSRRLQPRSPDGRWTVVGWADADQLVFTRLGRPRQIRAVSDVSAQFRSRSFPTIEGWCCAP